MNGNPASNHRPIPTPFRVRWLRFEFLNVVESEALSAMAYLRTSGVDARPHRVVEILEWDGDLLKAVRVYHP